MLASGTRVGAYLLEDLLAEGGMGAVYRARDERLGRTVALKVLAAGLAADESFRRRFADESRIAAARDHPHVVPIYEAGESDGRLFIGVDPGAQFFFRETLDPFEREFLDSRLWSFLDLDGHPHVAGLAIGVVLDVGCDLHLEEAVAARRHDAIEWIVVAAVSG